MPAYQEGPNFIRKSLLPGDIGFSFGRRPTINNSDTKMSVSKVAITGNVATLTVQILEGPIPVVGSSADGGVTYTGAPTITVTGTQTVTSGGAPNFNVTNIALATVSIDLITGAGTVTFALTSSNIAAIADSGLAIVPAYISTEALPGTAAAGRQFAVASANLSSDGQRGIVWWTFYTGTPSTVTAQLQGANVDADAYYTTVDQSTNAAGESRSLGNINYAFYRVNMASTGGTSPTVASGISVR